MNITERSYREGDLPLLQTTLAQWIAQAGECGYYHPGNIAHRIYEGFSGILPREELVHLWEEAGELIGFTYSFVFESAFFAFVAPLYRGTAIERTIVQSALARTERLMVATKQPEQTAITDVYDCDHARIDLLTKLGFVHYRTWDWITKRSLTVPIPTPAVPDGFVLRPAAMDDADDLAAIRNSSFGGNWQGEVYHQQVMTSPGYRPDRELIVVAPDGQVAAFTVLRLDEHNRVGLFEPVGTHRDFRRLGLARAVVLYGLQVLQRHGMVEASIEHTAENEPALALYRSLGFEKRYETLGFRRG